MLINEGVKMLLSRYQKFKFSHIGLIDEYSIEYLRENIRIIAECDRAYLEKAVQKQLERNREKSLKNSQKMEGVKELLGINVSLTDKLMVFGIGLVALSLFPIFNRTSDWSIYVALAGILSGVGIMEGATQYQRAQKDKADKKERLSLMSHPIARLKQHRIEKERKKIDTLKEIVESGRKYYSYEPLNLNK